MYFPEFLIVAFFIKFSVLKSLNSTTSAFIYNFIKSTSKMYKKYHIQLLRVNKTWKTSFGNLRNLKFSNFL